MQKIRTAIPQKVSVSLAALASPHPRTETFAEASLAAGVVAVDGHQVTQVAALVESDDAQRTFDEIEQEGMSRIALLSDRFLSISGSPRALAALAERPEIRRIQTKKEKEARLDTLSTEIGIRSAAGGPRIVDETGEGVLIGVVDSGFDLSHPAFRDAAGNLRVEALYDQRAENFYTTATLTQAWSGGQRPGDDQNGHGTHVASIAGGSLFSGGSDGVAPGARFLLVKTNLLDTDVAVSWIFARAADLGRPCVVNLSLGHHFGGHDGSDEEERLYEELVSVPGRAIVVAAGNEREENIHLGGYFYPGQSEEVTFDLFRTANRLPSANLSAWYSDRDAFEFTLIMPTGQELPLPVIDSLDQYTSSSVAIALGVKRYVWSNAVYAQLSISILNDGARSTDLRGWKLGMRCVGAAVGRLDAWFSNSGYAEFRPHRLVDISGTIGLPGTGPGTITVASHISKNSWQSDGGAELDVRAVVGRSSPFSSVGPCRDGRWKPDISAPGQYVTAALADRSQLTGLDDRALVGGRLLTIEGTSMASPVVAGVVAQLLQKRPSATSAQLKEALQKSARHDPHTGPALWNPAYGYGKIDVARAIQFL